MSSSATAIIGYDIAFYDKLPELFPHTNARVWFTGNEALIADTAFLNGTLQGAYLMLAARALGLDCGPMSGFDNDAVDTAFGLVLRRILLDHEMEAQQSHLSLSWD